MSEARAEIIDLTRLAQSPNPFGVLITRYQRKPLAFVTEVLGVQPDPWQHKALSALQGGHRRLSIRSGHGVGKLQGVNDVVPTPDGNRRWGDLQSGDRLFGRDGEPTHIVARYDQGIKPLYRVTFDDGTWLRVGAEHLWTVRGRAQRRIDSKRLYRKGEGRRERRSTYADDFITLSTEEIMARGVKRPNGASVARQWELPPHGPAQYPAQDVPLPPYLLGAYLADGISGSGVRLAGNAAKAEIWRAHATAAGIATGRSNDDRGDRVEIRLHGAAEAIESVGLKGLTSEGKFVPKCYLENTPSVRLLVLQGLMDADGYCDDRGIAVYTSVSRQLALDVAWLVRSLGGKAFVGAAQPSHYTKDGERIRAQDHYDVTVRLPPGLDLFTLPFKAKRQRPCEPRYLTRWIESIEPDGEEEAMCVRVDAPDGLYLARDFIVTHNTAFLAWVLCWHMLTRFPQKSVVTAPSAPQLFDALWAELRTWISRLPAAWQGLLEPFGDRVALKGAPDESFISARTSRAESPEALQGVHSTHVLLLVDEASGVPEAVFEAASGSMSTPGAITILTGNPTRSTGFFHRTHTVEADRWWTIRVSALDSPRVDPAFVEEIAQRYGRDSNAFRVRVLGEFPESQGDTLIADALVQQAMERVVEPDWSAPEIWGVDVARFGQDSSVLIKRRDKLVVELPRRWSGLDTMQLTGQITNEWNRTAPAARPKVIVVDSIGIGAGVEDRLRELDLPAIGVNVAETPSVESRFYRLRDELWQATADWLNTRLVSLPPDQRLRDDLVGPRYDFTSDGRLVVESKSKTRARGLASPDHADALCLTFAPGAATAVAFAHMRWNQPLHRKLRGLV